MQKIKEEKNARRRNERKEMKLMEKRKFRRDWGIVEVICTENTQHGRNYRSRS